MGSHAGTLAVPFLRRRHIWQHKETCIARGEGEAGGAGDESRMQKCWHESCCCCIAAHAHTLTNSMAREPASSHPWKQKLSPLDRLQTLRQTNCQGGTASLPLGAVSCSVKKASQPARLYRCLLAPAFASGRAPVTATRKPLLAACLLFPAARLTLQHAQSHVLLVCRQSSNKNGLACPA